MDRFSFAYMKEAFVATLLAMANDRSVVSQGGGPGDGGDDDDELERYELWKEMKAQVKLLREDMDSSTPSKAVTEEHIGHDILQDESAEGMREGMWRWEVGSAKDLTLRRQSPFTPAGTDHCLTVDRRRAHESLDAFARFEPLDHFEKVPDVL